MKKIDGGELIRARPIMVGGCGQAVPVLVVPIVAAAGYSADISGSVRGIICAVLFINAA